MRRNYLRNTIIAASILIGALAGYNYHKYFPQGTIIIQKYTNKDYNPNNLTSRIGATFAGGLAGIVAGVAATFFIENNRKRDA